MKLYGFPGWGLYRNRNAHFQQIRLECKRSGIPFEDVLNLAMTTPLTLQESLEHKIKRNAGR